ncbi:MULTISPECIES: flavin-containing monooxygenase [unclassified Microbacterium]|uniref:flavin-containing monooxygenase n=1 Tax=Microbacterium TaxID=33882 RepID=UPI003BA372BF
MTDSIDTGETDLDALRQTYRRERDRRLRPDGPGQYRRAAGSFGFSIADPWTPRTDRTAVTDAVEVLVVGAGFGGLLTASRLRAAGFDDIRLMDEAGDVGGTWYWNRYPGIHCDVEASVYMPLLEEIGSVPEWRYAPGDEIRRHAEAIARHFDLYRDTLFHTRATSLAWDEAEEVWTVETDRGDRFTARYVIVSSGTLSEPKLPGIPGIEGFRGHTFHTSRWDYGYTGGDSTGGLTRLADKHIAIVGTGATGLQVVPHLAEASGHLFVFQRTPSTVDVRDNRRTDPAWAASLRPGWQRERMDDFLAVLAGEKEGPGLVDDGWTRTAHLQRPVLSGADSGSGALEEELVDAHEMSRIRRRVDEVVTDPETAAKLKPWYRYMCKRPGFSDTYLESFNRPNVTLVDTADAGGITRVSGTSVFVGDEEFLVDAIVFATGFEVGISGVVSGTLPVTGRGGRSLLESWASGPRTLHGFYSHGFPNLIHLGAFQNANSVNFVHILQDQADHIAAVLAGARSAGAGIVEPTAEAEQEWVDEVARTSRDSSAFQAACTPGYYNAEGARPISGTYSPGPIAFRRVLERWRTDRMHEVFSEAAVSRTGAPA